jgi:hypothetical protein
MFGFKTVSGTGQTGGQETGQKLKFLGLFNLQKVCTG